MRTYDENCLDMHFQSTFALHVKQVLIENKWFTCKISTYGEKDEIYKEMRNEKIDKHMDDEINKNCAICDNEYSFVPLSHTHAHTHTQKQLISQ